MRILADENIPFAREAFSALSGSGHGSAHVTTAAGRSITAEALRNIDLLIVRSVTKVNAKLLAQANALKFVGTCTIGTDHIDMAELQKRGIAFASAPGSNADSVWEWFASVVLALAERGNFKLTGKTLGVVGCGNVGERIARRAEAILQMRVLRNDPPLAQQNKPNAPAFYPLDELCSRADIITCHTPLESTGPHPTLNLFDSARLALLHDKSILINAGRGEVVNGAALLAAIRAQAIGPVALDVWDHEPAIDRDLLSAVAIGTPHIAGYSYNGKVNATKMIYDAACARLKIEPTWTPGGTDGKAIPPPPNAELLFDAEHPAPADEETALRQILRHVYDVRTDDASLRAALHKPADQTGAHFDALRKNYPQRRECTDYKIKSIRDGVPLPLLNRLSRCGFIGERIVTRLPADQRPPSGKPSADPDGGVA
ncbi:MAG TPA: 4-phosphoerythronate dehydrogenase [Planctomycetota bacterium]|nr:4-phosphoerythronate dehydrogenase [Planctomycetota bacterium]